MEVCLPPTGSLLLKSVAKTKAKKAGKNQPASQTNAGTGSAPPAKRKIGGDAALVSGKAGRRSAHAAKPASEVQGAIAAAAPITNGKARKRWVQHSSLLFPPPMSPVFSVWGAEPLFVRLLTFASDSVRLTD
jgi:hypothetical protein